MQFDVKIRKVIENGKPLKAVASVTVDGAFVIHNVRVIETENAKFVAMPYATYQDAEGKDSNLGVSKAQVEAMLAGSMFGWDVPAADPKSYDENGKLLHNPKDRGDAR